MALSDISAPGGDHRDFISEVPIDALNAPLDILIEASSPFYPVEEIPNVENTSVSFG